MLQTSYRPLISRHLPLFGMLSLWLLGSTVGCFDKPESIRIDGSSTVYPISATVKDKFVAAKGGARINVSKTGTSGGITSFSRSEIDICDASRPIKDSERQLCQEAGINFTEFTVAYDGISLVVNTENDWCDCLTVEQLRELWRSDSTVQKWSDLDPEWPDEPIKLFGPDENSGTFAYFNEEILEEGETCRADYSPSAEDNQLVRGVQNDKYALAYFGYAYYAENSDTLNIVGVDSGAGCVKPTIETIKENSYAPLSRPLFIYVSHQSLAKPAVAEFVNFYLSEVDKLAVEAGYVPTPPEVTEANLSELAELKAAAE